jgi:hypothetical protein
MELFNNSGFEINDRVSVIIENEKYFGTVIDIDNRIEKIKVDFTAKSKKAVEWFGFMFWKREGNS